MRAELKFELADESDREEFHLAVHSKDLAMAMQEWLNWMRGELKHGDLSEETYEAYDKAREKFFEYVDDYSARQALEGWL